MWHGRAGRPSPGFPPRIGVRGMLLIAGVTNAGNGESVTEAIQDRGPGHAFVGITMALRRPHKRMKIVGCRGPLAGKKLRRYGVPHPWTPAPYRGPGHAFDRRSDELGVYPGS